MKFSASQIQFLMTKMTISNIDAFNAEASSFVPTKTKKPRVIKPVAQEDICKAIKKDGHPCCNKKKSNGLCGRHLPKLVPVPTSAEIINCSDSDTQ